MTNVFMTKSDMHCDLMRQGFMKPRRERKAAVVKPVVTCDDCLNWHRQGSHTADAATRKANHDAVAALNAYTKMMNAKGMTNAR